MNHSTAVKLMAVWLVASLAIWNFLCSAAEPNTTKPADTKSKPADAKAIPPQQVYGQWQHAGWGGGGFYWCAAAHPTNPNVIYLGGDVAGVYKTEDQGKQWRFITKGLPGYEVYSLSLAKSAPDTIYVMTVNGMAKTTNGGGDWIALPPPGAGKEDDKTAILPMRDHTVQGLAVDPANAEVVYAGSEQGALYKTTDGGKTWQKLAYIPKPAPTPDEPAPDPKAELGYTLLADWENDGDAAQWVHNQTEKDYFYITGVQQSKDLACHGRGCLALQYSSEGGTWSQYGRCSLFFGKDGKDLSQYKKLTAHFLLPGSAPIMEAELVVQTGANWAWQAGEWTKGKNDAWVEVSLDLTKVKDLNSARCIHFVLRSIQSGYHGKVFLDAVALHTNPASVVKPSPKLIVTEGGVITGVCVREQDPKTVFVATEKFGLMRSQDAGATWKQVNPAKATSVAASPHDPRTVLASFSESGVMISGDDGQTWVPINEGITLAKSSARDVAFHPKDPKILYAIVNQDWNGTFYRSTDGGKTWKGTRAGKCDSSANPTYPQEISKLTNIAVSPAAPDMVFLSANWRAWLSQDAGVTFEERDRGADMSCVYDIAFCNDKAYAVCMDEGLFVSQNNGAVWRQLYPLKYSGELEGHQWRVLVTPQNGTERILTTLSPWHAGKPNFVLRSEDGGKNFAVIREGLPTYVLNRNIFWDRGYARGLAMDPKDPNVIYLGVDGDAEPEKKLSGGGVFKSTDGGKTWRQLPNQPGSRRGFFCLAVDPTDSKRIYWAACGKDGGLWRTEDGGESWKHALKQEKGELWFFNVAVDGKGNVYTGAKDLFKSTDHGATWKQVTKFTGDLIIEGLEADPQSDRVWLSRIKWFTVVAGEVWRTTDGGASWEDITGELPFRKPAVLRYNPRTNAVRAAGAGRPTIRRRLLFLSLFARQAYYNQQ
ncbi:MAG: hypothetical protein NTX50_19010 [Candidatus Sumerlaeota bacterium]|nr:hypothetical protein [Candidatus Sumerlaeota bacterium]